MNVNRIPEETLERAVQDARRYKGSPWSETEYLCHRAMTRNELLKDFGPEIAAEFERRCNALPSRKFNNWSGD